MEIINFLLCLTECKLDLSGGKQTQNFVSRLDIDVSNLVPDKLNAVAQNLLVGRCVDVRLLQKHKFDALVIEHHV